MRYKTVFVYATPGTSTKDTFFKGSVSEESPYWIDGVAFATETEAACNRLDDEGYEIISITEVTRGSSSISTNGGAGWSVTHGVLITARRLS